MGAVAESVPLLLERDAQMARASALLAEASAGRGAVVVVGGPAGIGKTELLAAVGQRARVLGFRVLSARGRELEAEMAFAVVRQLVEAAVLSADARERRRLLAGPARVGAGALGLAAGAAPDSEFAAVHGLYWLCVNLAGRGPLLVTVDDVQWVDGPSLSWLGYFGRRAAELPVLVVVSVREGDPLVRASSVAAVVNDPAVHRIGLLPLSAEQRHRAGSQGSGPGGQRRVLRGVLGAFWRQPAVRPGAAGGGPQRRADRERGRCRRIACGRTRCGRHLGAHAPGADGS